MCRWTIPAATTLAETPAGVFARLAAEAALEGLEPVTLLALLKHPMCRFDARAVATLERAVLRGPRPKAGTAGLAQALANFRDELGKLRRRRNPSCIRSDPRGLVSNAASNARPHWLPRLQPGAGAAGKPAAARR